MTRRRGSHWGQMWERGAAKSADLPENQYDAPFRGVRGVVLVSKRMRRYLLTPGEANGKRRRAKTPP